MRFANYGGELKCKRKILTPQWKVAVAAWRHGHSDHMMAIVSGWSRLYLADLERSTDALRNNSGLLPWGSTAAPVKGGCIQKLDHMHGHSERVMHCHQGLNLKVDKINYHLGSLHAEWAVFLESGQYFSRSGEKNKFIYFLHTSLFYPIFNTHSTHNSKTIFPNSKSFLP